MGTGDSQLPRGFQFEQTATEPKIFQVSRSWLLAVCNKKVLSFVASSLADKGVCETPDSQALLTHVGDGLPQPARGTLILWCQDRNCGQTPGFNPLHCPEKKAPKFFGDFHLRGKINTSAIKQPNYSSIFRKATFPDTGHLSFSEVLAWTLSKTREGK